MALCNLCRATPIGSHPAGPCYFVVPLKRAVGPQFCGSIGQVVRQMARSSQVTPTKPLLFHFISFQRQTKKQNAHLAVRFRVTDYQVHSPEEATHDVQLYRYDTRAWKNCPSVASSFRFVGQCTKRTWKFHSTLVATPSLFK